MQVIPDLNPRAGMIRPFEDGKATLSKVVDLAFWAKDDYGLDQAWIVYSLNDGSEQRWPLGSLEGKATIDDRAELAGGQGDRQFERRRSGDVRRGGHRQAGPGRGIVGGRRAGG